MKWLTPLLLALSLAGGTIACMTAYSPRLDAVAEAVAAGETIELGASSGKLVDAEGNAAPVAEAGVQLTPELIAALRAGGVERVRVRQFAFVRWSHGSLFAVSCAGLIVGAVLVRRGARARLTASTTGTGAAGSPATALACVREVLRKLDAEMPALRGAGDGMERVTAELGELQATHLDTILQSRERIIAAGGLGGFAAFMSAFSVMERQINRAWSAAADDSADEVADCLKRALALLDDTERLLPR